MDLPLAGRVIAAGLTIPEFKAELSSALARYISNPVIEINLAAGGSRPVSVIGEVATPGVHQLEGTKRLLEILAISGGLKPDAGPKGSCDEAKEVGEQSTPSINALTLSPAPRLPAFRSTRSCLQRRQKTISLYSRMI